MTRLLTLMLTTMIIFTLNAQSIRRPLPRTNVNLCPAKCERGITYVNKRGRNNRCELVRTIPCFPYKCSSPKPFCNAICANDSFCAPGAICDPVTHTCTVEKSCDNLCTNGFLAVREKKGGQCTAKFKYSCYPYKCDVLEPTRCYSDCTNDHRCAPGAVCDPRTKQCIHLTYQCSGENNEEIIGSDGTSTSCVPYVCKAGKCTSTCVATAQCAQGYYCDRDTQRCYRP